MVRLEKATEVKKKCWAGLVFKIGTQKVRYVDFAKRVNMAGMNTFFQKRQEGDF